MSKGLLAALLRDHSKLLAELQRSGIEAKETS